MNGYTLAYRYLTGDDRPVASDGTASADDRPVASDGPDSASVGSVPAATDPVVVLCCGMDTIVADESSGTKLPGLARLLREPTGDLVRRCKHWHLAAEINETPVYAVALSSDEMEQLAAGAPALKRASWRETLAQLDDFSQAVLGRGMQLARWFAASRYCPACATSTEHSKTEAVARCPACGDVQYPRMAPAMIVSVIRDGKILLAQAPRFRGTFYSVLAGFVEPGESVEECVHREVCEEAGVTVKSLRYFGSQSWPMPHSLMLAFIADWESGEITIDQDELVHADWYGPHELPNVPSEVSIAGRMIRWFQEEYG